MKIQFFSPTFIISLELSSSKLKSFQLSLSLTRRQYFINFVAKTQLTFNLTPIQFRFTIMSSTRRATKARTSSKSTCRAVKSSPKSCSIVRSKALMPWRWRHATVHRQHDPTVISSQIQVRI